MAIVRRRQKALSLFFLEGYEDIANWLVRQGDEELLSAAEQIDDRFAREKVRLLRTPNGVFVVKTTPRSLRTSKSLRDMRNGLLLSSVGLPCVYSVVVLRKSDREIALSPYRSGVVSGINLVWGGMWDDLGEERRRGVLECVAHLVARLHKSGFVHGDLNSSNILFKNLYSGGIEALLLDLSGVRRATFRARVKDVARLWRSTRRIISLWQGLRFLLRYCRLTGQDARKFLTAVERRVRYLDSRRPKQ